MGGEREEEEEKSANMRKFGKTALGYCVRIWCIQWKYRFFSRAPFFGNLTDDICTKSQKAASALSLD